MKRGLPVYCVVLLLALTGGAAADTGQEDAPIVSPKLIHFEKVILPPGTPAAPGAIKLLLHIGPQGKVTKTELSRGIGEPFDAAVQRAARLFRYRPASQGGKAMTVRLLVEIPLNQRTLQGARRSRLAAPPRRSRRSPERSPGYHYAGRVLEQGTRTPLGGVMVVVRDPRFGREQQTVTDRQGGFSFDGLAPGRQTLEVITGGYAHTQRGVRPVVRPKGDAIVEGSPVYLTPLSDAAHRTIVVEKRRKEAASEITLSDDELTMTPGTLGDPTRVIQTLPGVSRSPFGLGYYMVRGSSFENTGFFIDGHPAFLLYHFFGGPAVIHPELVGSISFYPGGYPAKYGRFATGAIVIETKDPPRDRWHLAVEVDLLKASALYSTPFDEGRGQITVSGRQSYYDLLLPLFTDNVSIGFNDYQLRLNYDIRPDLRVRLLLLGSEDSFGSTGGASSSVSQTAQSNFDLGFHRVLGAVDWDISKAWSFRNSLIFEYDHTSNFRSAEETDDLNVNIQAMFVQLRSWTEFKPHKRFSFEAGLDTFYAHFDSSMKVPILPPMGDPAPPLFSPITTQFNLSGPFTSLASYAMADWEPIEGLRILPGLRLTMDQYATKWHTRLDPRLSVRWEFVPGLTLKGMGGIAHQPPGAFQVLEPVGDPNIPPVSGTQGSVGIEWQPSDDWEITAEGFFNYMTNIARPADSFESTEDSVQRVLWAADVLGRAYGLEVMVRKRFGGRFHGWLSYTLARSERLYPPDSWTLFTSDQTHILNIAASYRLPWEMSIGGRFTLTSGNPFYPVLGSRYDADRDNYTPIFSAQTSRLPTYARLDMRIDKRWRYDTWMLEAFADFQNVTNASNPEAMVYSYDYTRQGAGPSFPFLVTFGVKALF